MYLKNRADVFPKHGSEKEDLANVTLDTPS